MKQTRTIFGSRTAFGGFVTLSVLLTLGGIIPASAQSNVVYWANYYWPSYPPFATNVVALDGGDGSTAVGLRSDGSAFKWGTGLPQDASIFRFTNMVAALIIPNTWDRMVGVYTNGRIRVSNSSSTGFSRSNYVWPGVLNDPYAGGGDLALGMTADGRVEDEYGITRLTNAVAVANYGGQTPWPEVPILLGLVALKPDGTLGHSVRVSWTGQIAYREIPIPSASNIVALASEANHVLALREDGTVFSWGSNFYGTTNVPAGLSNVIAIAASQNTSLALKSDGTVAAWGLRTNVPPGLTNVMAIACSEQEGLALLAHGKPFLTCPLPDRVGLAGGKVYFRMQASGEWPLSYQWRYCGTNLPGQTNMVLKLSNLEPADAGPYSVVVSNALGEAVSREARLSLAPFFIQRDPQGTNIGFGGSANLAVQVQSQFPLSYQWRFNGADIPGATNGTLSLENATFEMTGNYSVVINNSFGVATSAVARVTVRQLVEWPATYEFQKFLDDTTNVISLDFVDASSGAGVVAVTEGSKLAMSFVSYEDQTKFAAPPNLTNVLSAVIGSYFDIARGLATALRGDGGLVEWGEAGYLPFGFPANLSNVVAVFAGSNDRNALQADGNIVTWQSGLGNWATNRQNLVGINDPLGIRGDGNVVTLWTWYSQTNIPASLTNVVAISGDDNSHYLGLRSDRTVTAWLPPDRMDDPYGYTLVPPGLSNVCAVVAGWYESFALRRDGTLAYWGGDEYMRTNIPPDAKGLVQLAAGYPSRIGVIGYGPPKVLAHAGHFSGVVGGQTLFQCKAAGKPPLYYQWRKDGVNLPGATNAMLVLRNTTTADNGVYSVEVRNALGTNVAGAAHLTIQAATFPQPAIPQQAFRGGSLTLAPQVYGSGAHSYQWLLNGVVIAGATNATLLLTGFDSTQAGQYSLRVSNEFGIAESPATSVGLMNVAAWGKYAPDCSGAFGDKPIFTPLGLADAVQVAAGGNHAVALRRNGTVVAWGSECDGKTSVPSGLSSVVGVAAGANHSLALLRDGRVVGWGNNSYGQTNPPPHLTNAIAIATAGHFSAALRNDGTVAVWGTDNPVPPAHLTNVAAIAVGNTWDGGWGIKHGLALRQNRTVAVWGYDFPGQTSVLATLTNVIAIAAGDEHSLALRSDGTVAAWGNNSYGQTNVPPGLSNVIAIAAGARHSLALRSDRTVVGWGENYGGQTNPPVGLSNAVAITAGGFMSLALVGTPETDRAHLALQLAAGKPEVHVSGPPGQVVAIQSSSNLVNWATVAYQTNYTGHWLWPDASAGDRESVFYRSVADGQTVTPFALSGATVSADGTIRFTVYGPPGWNFRLEASTNLLHWTPVAGLKSIGETPVSLKLPGGPAAQLMRVVAP